VRFQASQAGPARCAAPGGVLAAAAAAAVVAAGNVPAAAAAAAAEMWIWVGLRRGGKPDEDDRSHRAAQEGRGGVLARTVYIHRI